MVSVLANNFPKVQTFSVDLDPGSVAANTAATETLTANGVTTADIVTVNKPSDTPGLVIEQAWVSAANTVSIRLYNRTGSPIDAGSETYLIQAVRR